LPNGGSPAAKNAADLPPSRACGRAKNARPRRPPAAPALPTPRGAAAPRVSVAQEKGGFMLQKNAQPQAAKILRRVRAEAINAIPTLTHILFALVPYFWSQAAAHEPPNWAIVLLAILLSNLPDIDTAASHIGRLLLPLSRFIESRFGHRTVTHSLIALLPFALSIIFFGDIGKWAMWFYASHLFLDMIVGGKTGIPLLYPNHTQFYILEVEPQSTGEKVICGLLGATLLASFLLNPESLNPSRLLHAETGNFKFALDDANQWRGHYRTFLQVEGVWDADSRPESGTFEVIDIDGEQLTLTDGERVFTAGQAKEDFRIIKAIAIKGDPITFHPTATPTVYATPVVVRIVVRNVYNPDREILVREGQVVTKGTQIADLATWRGFLLPPTPTPVLNPTRTPTYAPNPLESAKALADLRVAEAAYNAAIAPPSEKEKSAARAACDKAKNDLWASQLQRDAYALRSTPSPATETQLEAMQAALFAKEVEVKAICNEADRIAKAQHAADDAAIALAKARLDQAKAAYRLAIAPPTARPTATPIGTPTASPDFTRVYALVEGVVAYIRVIAVEGPSATVEVLVTETREDTAALSTPTKFARVVLPAEQTPEKNSPLSPTDYPSPPTPLGQRVSPQTPFPKVHVRVFGLANVKQAVDGDTIDVRALDGTGQAYRVRLIGVNTPETTTKQECFGKEAKDFTTQMLLNKVVALEVDVQQRDQAGRLLAYVWLVDKDNQPSEMFNRILVRNGYAKAMAVAPNLRYENEFAALERGARNAPVGMWANCVGY